MAGKTPDQIESERKEAVEKLTNQGYEVIDTVIKEQPNPEVDESIWYLAKSIEYIGKVATMYFMDDWENARGCRIEHQVAKDYGRKIIYQTKKQDDNSALVTGRIAKIANKHLIY